MVRPTNTTSSSKNSNNKKDKRRGSNRKIIDDDNQSFPFEVTSGKGKAEQAGGGEDETSLTARIYPLQRVHSCSTVAGRQNRLDTFAESPKTNEENKQQQATNRIVPSNQQLSTQLVRTPVSQEVDNK